MPRVLQDGSARLLQTGDQRLLQGEVPNVGPVIDTQPQDATVEYQEVASFTVVASDADEDTLTYQWYDASDDSALSGETSATLEIATTIPDNGAQYYAIVSDGIVAVQSDTVTLTVTYVPFVWVEEPDDYVAFAGNDASFYGSATGKGSVSYQWEEETAGDLPGKTSTQLVVSTVASDDGSRYRIKGTDGYGDTYNSAWAELSVEEIDVCAVSDVRILGPDGVWTSIMGAAGDPASAADLIDDAGPKLAKTYSSVKIEERVATKLNKSEAAALENLVTEIDGGAPDAVQLTAADGGAPDSTYSVFHVIDGGGP